MQHKIKHISCSVMIVLIVAFDQITKYLAELNLSDGETVTLVSNFVQFRYALNTGMAFSMFSGARWVFIVLTIFACLFGLYYMFFNKCKSLWLYWSLGVIISGGIGNLIDRVRFGYVIDFIEPIFVDFAVFNIADCAVTLGAIVLIGYLLFDSFKKEKKDE